MSIESTPSMAVNCSLAAGTLMAGNFGSALASKRSAFDISRAARRASSLRTRVVFRTKPRTSDAAEDSHTPSAGTSSSAAR